MAVQSPEQMAAARQVDKAMTEKMVKASYAGQMAKATKEPMTPEVGPPPWQRQQDAKTDAGNGERLLPNNGGHPLRAALFVRVSDDDQDTAAQLAELQREAATRRMEVVSEVVLDGESAFRESKLAKTLKELQEDGRRERYEVLIIAGLDRLSRRGITDTLETLTAFRKANIRIVSINDPWLDMPNEFTELLVAITAFASSFESRRRSSYTKRGLDAAAANGVQLGRPDRTQYVDIPFVHEQRDQEKPVSWDRIAATHRRTVPTPDGGRARPSRNTIKKAYAIAVRDGVNVALPEPEERTD